MKFLTRLIACAVVVLAASALPAIAIPSVGAAAGAAGVDWDPSGQAMPVGDIPGWHQIFADNFANVSLPLGSFTGCGNGSCTGTPGFPFGGASDGEHDTSGHCKYYPSKVLSVTGGIMDYYVHTDPDGTCMGASMIPAIPKLTYETYSIRFRADPAPGYKEVAFLWPVDDVSGEIDYPENHLDSTVTGSVHTIAGGTPIQLFTSSVASTDWHTATLQWTPTSVTMLLDGALVGTTTVAVPQTPMTFILRAESDLLPAPPPPASSEGHVQIDWVTVYSYASTPSITSVSPAVGQGSVSSTLKLTGPGFTPGTQLSFADPGITELAPPTVVMPNELTVPVSVAPSTAAGTSDVTVTDSGGTSTCSGCVTVSPGPGTVTASPSAIAGQSVPITVSAPNLLAGARLSTTVPGGVFGPITPDGSGSITSKLTVGWQVPQGDYDLTVTNRDGGTSTCSGCLAVAVKPTAPVVSLATAGNGQATLAFSPPSSDGGSPVNTYVVTADDLTDPQAVRPTQSGPASPVTVTGLTPGDRYKLVVRALNAAGQGPPSADSNMVMPTSSTPSITSVKPAVGQGSLSSTLTLTGPGFTPGTQLSFADPGITELAPPTVVDTYELTVPVSVRATTPVGTSDVTVTDSGGTSTCRGCVTVSPGPGAVTASPSAIAGQSVPITVSAPNLLAGARLSTTVPGGVFGPITPDGSGSITSKLTVGWQVPQGDYDVTVTNRDGGTSTCSGCLAVAVKPTAPVVGLATAGNGQATLAFSPPSSDGGLPVSSYVVTADDLTDPQSVRPTQSGPASPVTVTGLTPGDRYKLVVRALNAAGQGPPSADSNMVMPTSSP